jgi:ribonuclease J
MKLIIHRGTHEIGGSCVELQTNNARILIDFGLPLSNDHPEKEIKKKTKDQLTKDKLLPDIKGLYENPEFDGILISHAHQDHYGLLSFVSSDIPIYMSKGTKELIELSYLFNQTNCDLKNIKTIEAWKSFEIKDIKITSYLVDHSGFDSMAFLIETENMKIFYSGDFRGHGRKSILFETMIKNPIQDIDYLIMEGTMLSRESELYNTEDDVENKMVDSLKSSGNLMFLSCSSQNMDRIVSAYKACLRTNTLFVLDPYSAYILYALKDIGKRLPQYDWDKNIRIFFIPNKYTDIVLNEKKMFKFKKAKITKEEVFSLEKKMLVKDSYTMRNIFKNKGLLKDTSVIYSMWEGYLNKQQPFWDKNQVEIIPLHVSGHAYVEDLIKFANALKSKNIIPIHTEYADKFKDYFKSSNIIKLDNGEKYTLANKE